MTSPSAASLLQARSTCPSRLAEDAAVLIRRGQPEMALSILERLPGRIRLEVDVIAYELGYRDALAATERLAAAGALPAAEPLLVEAAAEVASAVHVLGTAKVATLLDADLAGLAEMLAGRVAPTPAALQQLRPAAAAPFVQECR